MSTGQVYNHREREKGYLVYPVHSRRSGGLSLGINLFPDRKRCSFDCPYCEVFPFKTDCGFSLPLMESALEEALYAASKKRTKVEDICFSGNGEPTQSSFFPAALQAAFSIRNNAVPEKDIVLITNGAGLLNEQIFNLLLRYALKGLRIWLKLDAGTQGWYQAMNRSAVPYEHPMKRILAFVKYAPVELQTMICAINGAPPPPDEKKAWEALVSDLASQAVSLRGIQIYGKARSAPEDPLASALPQDVLEERAESLRIAIAALGKKIPVNVYP